MTMTHRETLENIAAYLHFTVILEKCPCVMQANKVEDKHSKER